MREKPLVTVITVSFNSEETIARTVESVLAQTYDKVEYIVMDGFSTDNTVPIVESYRPRFEEKGYRFKVISELDQGMYDALNKGVAMAEGEVIGQINSDDWYEPNAVERMVDTYLEKDFDVFWADLRILKRTGPMIKRAKYNNFMTTRHWNHPTTFIRASVYKTNPYELRSMCDDFELILRLHKQHRKMVVLNEVLANFTFGGMSTQKSWSETMNRIHLRCDYYKRNGYGFVYYVDSAVMELAKYILG